MQQGHPRSHSLTHPSWLALPHPRGRARYPETFAKSWLPSQAGCWQMVSSGPGPPIPSLRCVIFILQADQECDSLPWHCQSKPVLSWPGRAMLATAKACSSLGEWGRQTNAQEVEVAFWSNEQTESTLEQGEPERWGSWPSLQWRANLPLWMIPNSLLRFHKVAFQGISLNG